MEELTAFEQLCYLFKNSEDDATIKAKERVAKKVMEKYERMANNEPIWILTEQIQMAKAQQRAIQRGYYDEGLRKGKEEGYTIGLCSGYSKLLNQQMQIKFNIDASSSLATLSMKQQQQVSQFLMNN